MKPNNEKQPWSAFIVLFCMTIFFAIPVQLFFDNTRDILIISFILASSFVLYSDYVLPYWRRKTGSRILHVVSSDENVSLPPPLKERAKPHSVASSVINTRERLSATEPIDISSIESFRTGAKHRFDRLRQYRQRYRNLISIILIILMVVFVIIEVEDFETCLPLRGTEGGWTIQPFLIGVFFTLCILLEYNIGLITGKWESGVFFRSDSGPLVSPAAGLQGEKKIEFLMFGNPFGIGMGIRGRPIIGIVFCLLWLSAIGSWTITGGCVLVAFLLMRYFRKAMDSPDGPFALLELRVFDTPSYGKFLELLEGWKYLGVQYRLDGPDTTGYCITSRFKALLGKASELVIKSEAELDTALARASTTPDKFERFDVNAMQCSDAIWIRALERTIERCDVVIMLLTDFSSEDKGCTVEVKILMDTVPLSRVVLLVNPATDLQYLSVILNDAWFNRAEDSPNHQITEGPYIFDLCKLYEHKLNDARKGVTVKMMLVDFLYNTIKGIGADYIK